MTSIERTRPDTTTRRRGCLGAALALSAFGLASPRPAWAATDGNYQIVGNLAAYLGVLPAELVRGHPASHPETQMHGGPPRGSHAYHIAVAFFDRSSGARIEDVEVAATISGMGHVGRTYVPLEPMLVAGSVTYGGFVTLPGSDRYAIAIDVRRPGQRTPTRINFSYDHRPG